MKNLQEHVKKHYLSDPEKIVIRKQGMQIFILSHFAGNTNVATRFAEGNENSYFLPSDAPLEDIYSGRLFAESWDNQAPFFTGRHGIVGGNHGSPFTFRVHLLRHWLFESDIGKVFTDDAGKRFVLVSVDSLCDLTFHSDLPDPGESYVTELTGDLHYDDGRTIVPETVTRGVLRPRPGGQLSPHRRYNKVRLLADGIHELADGETAECSFAELHQEVDLVLPDALLTYLKDHPGKYVSPVDPRLPGAIRSCELITFRSRCCRTVESDFTFLLDFPESLRHGVLQFYGGIGFSKHERFLPGVKALDLSGQKIDLANVYAFPDGFSIKHYYKKSDCPDPKRLPCRYIDFFGNGGLRELGIVLGYSITDGLTARGNEEERGDCVLCLYPSTKIYPYAYERDSAKTGDKFRISAYQQFFLPHPSEVSCYQHQERDGYFLYADFLLENSGYEVKFPIRLAGKPIEILEQDPGISIDGGISCIPEDGRICLKATRPGGITLRIS